jgi:pumilio RNA-binding family
VVQWVIEKGDKADRSLVISKIFGQVLPLAQQKFASNVIEKCVVHADEEERRRIIEEVLTPGQDGTSVVKAMLVHPYANYVMQSDRASLGLVVEDDGGS